MKNYVSVILINTLIIQLVGCYTQKDINYEEFSGMEDIDDVVIFYNTDNKLILNKTSFYNNWFADTDTLIIYSTSNESHLSNSSTVNPDILKLSKRQINKVHIWEYDMVKTIIFIPILAVSTIVIFKWLVKAPYIDLDLM